MRKTLCVGLFLAAIVAIVAGDYWINRSGAQDAPQKAEPEKKIDSDLYDILKRDLEAKKDGPPSIPVPPTILLPKELNEKDQVPPPPPVVINAKPPELPALPGLGQTPPPLIVPPPLPTPQVAPPQDKESVKPKDAAPTFPPLPQTKPLVDDVKPLPPMKPPVPEPGGITLPKEFQPKKDEPNPLVPQVDKSPLPPISTQPIAEQVAKLKNCPWSLQVDVIDGQTIVTATVSKKHEFKIVCQSLDLQTGKGTLRASGKVQITGDMMTASCDQLAIPLMEDRLLLEGGAQVAIQKISTVSTERPARFELKGDRLDLRVGDLKPDKAVQATPSVLPPLDSVQLVGNPPVKADEAGKKWTPFGTLRRVEAKIYPGNELAMWTLESRDGNVIARVLARHGGSMRSFEGQTISVLGVSERIDGETYLRVTHVALP